jgi:hypothetical protein
MNLEEPLDDLGPRKLNTGDKVFLSFAMLVTLARVATSLGAAFSLLAYAITYDIKFILYSVCGVVLYFISTAIMHLMSKQSSKRADAYRTAHAA